MKLKLLIACTLIKLTVAAEICNSSVLPAAQHALDETLKRTAPLYGLSTISDEHLIKTQCHKHLQRFQNGLRQKLPWALKMLDASASLESGFTFGNNFWLGNIEVCHAVTQPAILQTSPHLPHRMRAELLTDLAPYAVDFRVIYLRHNSSWQVDPLVIAFGTRVHVGLCLPTACTEHEIRARMAAYLSSELFAGNALYDMHLQYDYAKDLQLKADTFRRTSFYLCCIFIAATVAVTIAASLLRHTTDTAVSNDSNGPVQARKSAGNGAVLSKSSAENQRFIAAQRFISCYDMQSNYQHIFRPSIGSHTFAALNGIRFISAIGVTMYHYVLFLFNGTRNKLTLFGYQVHLGNVDVFVDIFFTISGFLQAYHHFRNVEMLALIRKNNWKQNLILIALHLFHRYLRLAPLYFLTIGISDVGAKLMDDISLFHMEYKMNVNCEQYWWRNVFFIQNLFNHNDMCVLWTWSLACDMQFSVLATLLLFLYVKHPRRTKLCLAVLAVCSVAYIYSYGFKLNFDGALESTFTFLTEIYINPLARILPYISGGIAGWFFVQQPRFPFTVGNRTLQFLVYLVVPFCLVCVFKPPFNSNSVFTSTTVLLLNRIIFTLACSGLILFSANGRRNWFFAIFESVFFQKFSRVVYAMFLLNPMIVYTLPGFSRSNSYANPLPMLAECIGVLVLLLLCSTLATLLFETPYQKLSALLIMRQSKQKLT